MKYAICIGVGAFCCVWTTTVFNLHFIPSFFVGMGFGFTSMLVASWWDSL